MAATGEPYSVAARDASAVRPVIARAEATLAAPSARIEFLIDTDITGPEPRERRRPGVVGRLASVAWQRVASRVDVDGLRDTFRHQAGTGFLEPASGRYLVDYRGYAEMRVGGKNFAGLSGAPLGPRHRDDRPRPAHDDPLGLLAMARAATEARHVGDEPVRGTVCRKVAVRAGSAELTVWTDDEHIRRVQYEEGASSGDTTVSRRWTLELWEFGPADGSLDWSRLPSFRTG